MRDGLVFVPSARELRDALRAEEPHQVVFEREVEHALPRVPLAARAAPELPVDAAGLVALGADDHQAAGGIVVAPPPPHLPLLEVRHLHLLSEGRIAGLDAADLTLLHARAEF